MEKNRNTAPLIPVSGEPFPSDLFTTLDAIGARVSYFELDSAGAFLRRTATVVDLLRLVIENPALLDIIVLASYELPAGDPAGEIVLAQKVAAREVNAHSIVNATTLFTLSPDNILNSASLVFGGIAPYAWHAARSEAALQGKALDLQAAYDVLDVLAAEVRDELNRWKARMEGLPSEGFTDEYRIQLATGFLYKAIVNAMEARGIRTPPALASSGLVTWGNGPIAAAANITLPRIGKSRWASPTSSSPRCTKPPVRSITRTSSPSLRSR